MDMDGTQRYHHNCLVKLFFFGFGKNDASVGALRRPSVRQKDTPVHDVTFVQSAGRPSSFEFERCDISKYHLITSVFSFVSVNFWES